MIRQEGRREGRQEGKVPTGKSFLLFVKLNNVDKVKHSHTGGKFFRIQLGHSKRPPPPQPPFALLLYDLMGVLGLQLGVLSVLWIFRYRVGGKSAVWAWPGKKRKPTWGFTGRCCAKSVQLVKSLAKCKYNVIIWGFSWYVTRSRGFAEVSATVL